MAANTGQIAPADEWLVQLNEEVLEPALPIVDAHPHLWLRNDYCHLVLWI